MSAPIQFDEAVGITVVQAGPFQGALVPSVVKEVVKQFAQCAKAAGLMGATLTELAGELIGVTTFSVASTLLPMFELYQGVQLDFSSRAWVPIALGRGVHGCSMGGGR